MYKNHDLSTYFKVGAIILLVIEILISISIPGLIAKCIYDVYYTHYYILILYYLSGVVGEVIAIVLFELLRRLTFNAYISSKRLEDIAYQYAISNPEVIDKIKKEEIKEEIINSQIRNKDPNIEPQKDIDDTPKAIDYRNL